MSAVCFTIPGPPQGKGRPRVVRTKTGASLTYTPDKTVAYEELVRIRYKAAASGFCFPENAQIGVQITAWFQIPKSKSRKVRFAMAAGQVLPTKKPDCDNIVKIVCDALNGIAYKDDQQVVLAQIRKRYAEIPKTEVKLWEV